MHSILFTNVYTIIRVLLRRPNRACINRTIESSARNAESAGRYRRCRRSSHEIAESTGFASERQAVEAVSAPTFPLVPSLHTDDPAYLGSNTFLTILNSHLLPSRRQLLSNISRSRTTRFPSSRNSITPHISTILLARCLPVLRSALLVLPSLKRHHRPQYLHFPMRGR